MRRSLLVLALLVLSTVSARADVEVSVSEDEQTRYVQIVGMALVICCALLIRYANAHFERVREAQRSAPAPVSLLVAERVARTAQRRAGMLAAIGIVGVPA